LNRGKIGIGLLGKYVLFFFLSRIFLPFNVVDTKIHTTQVKHDVLCVVISYRKFKIRNTKRSDIIARGKE
jgi:hypothetical protein